MASKAVITTEELEDAQTIWQYMKMDHTLAKVTVHQLLRIDFHYLQSRAISVRINNHADIRTKGNTNIKNSLIRICDTDKNRMDKLRQINNTCTHKRESYG